MPNETWAGFVFNWVHQTIVAFPVAALVSSFDVLQAVLLLQCTYMIDYLNVLLKPLTTSSDQHNESTMKLLKEVFETHLKLKSFANLCNKIHAVVNLFLLFESAGLMCVTIYNLTTAAADVDNITSILFAIVATCQPVLYCFIGQHLSDKFEELYYKMTEISWYQFTKEEKRIYLILLLNIQQPVMVRTYVGELSLAVFVTVNGG